ncbi:uncharacterized protein LOC124775706 [Schistocerca piceifrons]|uniref:uncharacterized protein LOC124775706 n=1 Tax=Schistocerca piceifrons TaxID=274613 RepID=UPI001F5E4B72|nr:uncharacterized protein LOC124775706 [Schistocerca piceifrons]
MLAPLSPAERERLLLDSLRGSGKFRWGRRQQEQVSPPPHWGYDARVANRAHRDRESPSSPLDPGYVRHAASNWPVTPPSGSRTPRTPSQSPSGSESSGSPPPAGQAPGAAAGATQRGGGVGGRAPRRRDSDDDDDDDVPAGGSLTTQLLQRWLRSRHARVGKTTSQP